MTNSSTLVNGYTCLANELLAALFNARLTARQWAVCMALIRKTHGYQKSEDDIGLSQLAKLTNIAKPHVSTTIKELVARNILHKRLGSYGHILAINTHYASWQQKDQACKVSDALAATNALMAKAARQADAGVDDGINAGADEGVDVGADAEVEDVTELATAETTKMIKATESVTALSTKMATESVINALPNWEKRSYQSGNTGVSESGTTKENHTKESLQKKTPKENIASPAMRERFERFYAIYPKKKSRALAEKAFCKIAPDEQLLANMLLAIVRAKTSAQWTNPQMIPYPASWLNAQGWLDDIQTAYSDTELAVIQAFNRTLGEQLGSVDSEGFVESRAGAIRHFLSLSKKPDWVSIYFSYVKKSCEIPPKTGFDWLIKPETFAKVREGHYQTA